MWKPLLVGTLAAWLGLAAVAQAKEPDKEKDKGKVSVGLKVSAPALLIAPASVSLSANAWSEQANHPVVRVDYYQGTTLIGTAGTPPYTMTWNGLAAGSYTLTAKAYNDKGDAARSAPFPIAVDAPPTVTLTSPIANQLLIAPASVTLSANAADSDGTVAKVDFFQGTMLIGTATAAPYAITWANTPAGSYTLTARATDNQGASTTSTAVSLLVDAAPTITLTSPVANSVFNAPGMIAITASAADSDGTVAKVEFYQGNTLIGTASAAPYTVTWANAPSGSYTLTAKATDNSGVTSTATPVAIRVNTPPAVSLTSPVANQSLTAPAMITLAANASDSDGTIAKVDFYQGGTLIGTATSAPYTVTRSNAAAGTYSLTTRATDNDGAVTTSTVTTVTVNAAPSVSLTSPTEGSVFNTPANITLSANAADSDGTVAKVDFFQGGTLIGTATSAPYTVTWSNAPTGNYTMTAIATDNSGTTTTATPVAIRVNAPPTVSLTSPIARQAAIAPATLTVSASATDSDGTITKVDFYQGGTLIGTATTAPYTASWNNVAAGSYTVTAMATDNDGAVTTSATISVTVLPNQLPSVTLTSPSAAQRFTAPAGITLTASASDIDGSITSIAFYQGTTLIGSATAAPYTATWADVPEGSYSLTAKATDSGGAETYSAAIAITVTSGAPKLYYLHSDHLETPRLVTDEQNKVVWRNMPLSEPFGTSPPEEDPDGDGQRFTMNLRFPGQYADRETNTNYNYFRDYNPEIGRYVQSDPIGLQGGINTYSYVEGNPLSGVDPDGLAGIFKNWGQGKPFGPLPNPAGEVKSKNESNENVPTGVNGIRCALGLGGCPTNDPALYSCLMARCTPECGAPFIIDYRASGTHMFDPRTTRCECILKGFSSNYKGGPPPGL